MESDNREDRSEEKDDFMTEKACPAVNIFETRGGVAPR